MLGCRVLLAAVVLTMGWRAGLPHGGASAWLGWGMAWPAITTLALFAVRRGERLSLTAILLGDGLLLGAAGWAMGDLLGGMGFVIVLHAVAATLFVSSRTGVRLAFWHCLVAMLLIDAVGLGLLPDTGSWTWSGAWPYYAVLWGAVLSTAALAARNEREARRRRHDREVRFGRTVTAEPAAALAEFGLGELSGRRAAVLADGGGPGRAVLIDGNGVTYVDRPGPESEPGPWSREPGFLLLARLDERTHAWFDSVLPGAQNLVVVPFPGGALVVEVGGRRVERGAVENTVRAARHASQTLQLAGVAR